MARLKLDNVEISDLSAIRERLAPLGVGLDHWSSGQASPELLSKPSLSEEEKESLLVQLDGYFEELRKDAGYQSRDLIVLHPEMEGLEAALEKFAKIHTHDDDEVRYIIDGEGYFGFVMPDGTQSLLLVEAGEYINVPKDTEHWFLLSERKRIKAVRYFTDTAGWTPVYTDRAISISP